MKEAISLDLERECRNCIYRKTGWICSSEKSQYFQQQISSEHTCGLFTPSKAEAHFIRAMSTNLYMLQTKDATEKERAAREINENYSAAIAAGLPAEDEVAAKIGIAIICARVLAPRVIANETAFQSEEMQKLLTCLREGGSLDKTLQRSEIAKVWFQLGHIDLCLDLKAAIIKRDMSRPASEQFVREQLSTIDHIHPTPLPRLMFRHAKYCEAQGKIDEANQSLANIRKSISRQESMFLPGIQDFRRSLPDAFRQTNPKPERPVISGSSSSSNATQKSGCFIATAAYGSELAPQIYLLNRFRDNVLLHSNTGRVFVKIYYWTSPPLARVIVRSKVLRLITRTLLISPFVHLLQLTAGKNGKNHQ